MHSNTFKTDSSAEFCFNAEFNLAEIAKQYIITSCKPAFVYNDVFKQRLPYADVKLDLLLDNIKSNQLHPLITLVTGLFDVHDERLKELRGL